MITTIFDLDGTISDPASGISRSINYALDKLGFETRPEPELHRYIGPHLNITFSELTGCSEASFLSKTIELFRERYIPIGNRENQLYTGIEKVLPDLVTDDMVLFIATTKRKDIAESVLRYFGITHFFCEVHGCDLHRTKVDLLREILSERSRIETPAVMIGDRDSDFHAAHEAGIPSIGVSWGYGDLSELNIASAVVDNPLELSDTIKRIAQQVGGGQRSPLAR